MTVTSLEEDDYDFEDFEDFEDHTEKPEVNQPSIDTSKLRTLKKALEGKNNEKIPPNSREKYNSRESNQTPISHSFPSPNKVDSAHKTSQNPSKPSHQPEKFLPKLSNHNNVQSSSSSSRKTHETFPEPRPISEPTSEPDYDFDFDELDDKPSSGSNLKPRSSPFESSKDQIEDLSPEIVKNPLSSVKKPLNAQLEKQFSQTIEEIPENLGNPLERKNSKKKLRVTELGKAGKEVPLDDLLLPPKIIGDNLESGKDPENVTKKSVKTQKLEKENLKRLGSGDKKIKNEKGLDDLNVLQNKEKKKINMENLLYDMEDEELKEILDIKPKKIPSRSKSDVEKRTNKENSEKNIKKQIIQNINKKDVTKKESQNNENIQKRPKFSDMQPINQVKNQIKTVDKKPTFEAKTHVEPTEDNKNLNPNTLAKNNYLNNVIKPVVNKVKPDFSDKTQNSGEDSKKSILEQQQQILLRELKILKESHQRQEKELKQALQQIQADRYEQQQQIRRLQEHHQQQQRQLKTSIIPNYYSILPTGAEKVSPRGHINGTPLQVVEERKISSSRQSHGGRRPAWDVSKMSAQSSRGRPLFTPQARIDNKWVYDPSYQYDSNSGLFSKYEDEVRCQELKDKVAQRQQERISKMEQTRLEARAALLARQTEHEKRKKHQQDSNYYQQKSHMQQLKRQQQIIRDLQYQLRMSPEKPLLEVKNPLLDGKKPVIYEKKNDDTEIEKRHEIRIHRRKKPKKKTNPSYPPHHIPSRPTEPKEPQRKKAPRPKVYAQRQVRGKGTEKEKFAKLEQELESELHSIEAAYLFLGKSRDMEGKDKLSEKMSPAKQKKASHGEGVKNDIAQAAALENINPNSPFKSSEIPLTTSESPLKHSIPVEDPSSGFYGFQADSTLNPPPEPTAENAVTSEEWLRQLAGSVGPSGDSLDSPGGYLELSEDKLSQQNVRSALQEAALQIASQDTKDDDSDAYSDDYEDFEV